MALKQLRAVTMIVLSVLLAACGGGGGDSTTSVSPPGTTTPMPTPSPTPTPSYWVPVQDSTWQIQLQGTLDTRFTTQFYDVDLFDTPQTTIAALQARGIHVVCYFSAGTAENWRSDYTRFAAAELGNALNGWPGENWVDTRSANVRSIMQARMQLAQSKGCDGVDPDNVDGYTNTPGLPLTAATQLDYNQYLATQAHALHLAVGLKNDMGQAINLVAAFDFAINESCNSFNECNLYVPFSAAGKAVFSLEYDARYRNNTNGARDAWCAAMQQLHISGLVRAQDLAPTYRYSCN